MKEFTLNANSWHFRLANWGNERIYDYQVRHGTDFCTYIKAVIKGGTAALFAYLLAATAVVWVGYSLYDIIAAIVNAREITWPGTIMFGVLVLALVLLLIGAFLYEGTLAIRRRAEEKPGFFTLAFRKFKSKTCFNINFEDRP